MPWHNGTNSTHRESVDLSALGTSTGCSLIRASLCLSSTSSVFDPPFAPAFQPIDHDPADLDVLSLNDNLCLSSNSTYPRKECHPPAILAAPTGPRLKLIPTESLSVTRWIESLPDVDVTSKKGDFKADRLGQTSSQSWIPEGSLYPPDVYASAVTAARTRSYQRFVSDYSSPTPTNPSPPTAKPASPQSRIPRKHVVKATNTHRGGDTVAARESGQSKLPKVTKTGTLTLSPQQQYPGSQTGRVQAARLATSNTSTEETERALDSSAMSRVPRGVSITSIPARISKVPLRPRVASANPKVAPPTRRKQRSIETQDMIISLRSQCATLEAHIPQTIHNRRQGRSTVSRSQQLQGTQRCSSRRIGYDALDTDFGSRLSLIYPRAESKVLSSKPERRSFQVRQRTRSTPAALWEEFSSTSFSDDLSSSRKDGTFRRYQGRARPSSTSNWIPNHRRQQSIVTPPAIGNLSRYTLLRARKKKAVRFAPLPVFHRHGSTSSSLSSSDIDTPSSDTVVSCYAGGEQALEPHHLRRYSPWLPVALSCPSEESAFSNATSALVDSVSHWSIPRLAVEASTDASDPESTTKAASHLSRSVSHSSHFFKRTRRSLSRMIRPEPVTKPSDGLKEKPHRASKTAIDVQQPSTSRKGTPGANVQTNSPLQVAARPAKSRLPIPLRNIIKRLK